MNILAIETTGPLASSAVLCGDKVFRKVNNTEYSHLEQIVPMTKELLEDAGVDPLDLDAIAVSEGPGSFTGLRIGMATVKGLAQIWGKDVVCVPTLASFAFGEYEWIDKEKKFLFVPLFDARRSQVYAAAYEPGLMNAVIEGAPYDLDAFLAKVKNASSNYDEVVFFGDGANAYKDKLIGLDFPHSFAPEEDRYQVADSVARLGKRLFDERKTCTCYDCEPNYMREAEAERKMKEKKAAENG